MVKKYIRFVFDESIKTAFSEHISFQNLVYKNSLISKQNPRTETHGEKSLGEGELE